MAEEKKTEPINPEEILVIGAYFGNYDKYESQKRDFKRLVDGKKVSLVGRVEGHNEDRQIPGMGPIMTSDVEKGAIDNAKRKAGELGAHYLLQVDHKSGGSAALWSKWTFDAYKLSEEALQELMQMELSKSSVPYTLHKRFDDYLMRE